MPDRKEDIPGLPIGGEGGGGGGGGPEVMAMVCYYVRI